jgi:hypothetical protein
MPANGAPLAAARNSWPAFAGVGCGFTRSQRFLVLRAPARPLLLDRGRRGNTHSGPQLRAGRRVHAEWWRLPVQRGRSA